MHTILDDTVPLDASTKALRGSILPYLRSHMTDDDADHVLKTEEATLSVLLGVQEADLESNPNLLRIASLDHQISLALASTIQPSPDEHSSVWTSAIIYTKKTNQLRIQKASLHKTRNTIVDLAKCMLRVHPTYLELGGTTQATSHTIRRQVPWLSRKAVAGTPFSPNFARSAEIDSQGILLRDLLELPLPDRPIPETMEAPYIKEESSRGYKLKITREQSRDIGIVIKQVIEAITSKTRRESPWEILSDLILSEIPREGVVSRRETPILARLAQKGCYQHDRDVVSKGSYNELAGLAVLRDCIPAVLENDEAGIKLEDAISPLESILTPQRLHIKSQQVLNVRAGTRVTRAAAPSSPTPKPSRSSKYNIMLLNWSPSDDPGLNRSAEGFHPQTARHQSLPISKRSIKEEKSDRLPAPSPLSLPSDFSVDIIESIIPPHDWQDSDGIVKQEEEPSSMAAVDDSVLVPGLFEKVKACLETHQKGVDQNLPSIPLSSQVRQFERFPIDMVRSICDSVSLRQTSLRDILRELTEKNAHIAHAAGCQSLNMELDWRPIYDAEIPPDSHQLLQPLAPAHEDLLSIAPLSESLWYWTTTKILPSSSYGRSRGPCITKRDKSSGRAPSLSPNQSAAGLVSSTASIATHRQTRPRQAPRKRIKREGLIELALGMKEDRRMAGGGPAATFHLLPPSNVVRWRPSLEERKKDISTAESERKPSTEFQNTSSWTESLRRIQTSLETLPPLTCLCALALLSDRTLCYGLARAGVKIAESAELEADVITSPRTAIVFQQVAALPSEVDRLAPYLGGLSDRYSRVVVVLIIRPSARDPRENSTYADPWSPSVIAAFRKLRQAVSRSRAISASVDSLAATLDTEYEYVFSENAVMSGCIVRACADRDEQEYVQEAGPEAGRLLFSDRDFLHADNYLIGSTAIGQHGLNSYVARMIGTSLTQDELLLVSLEELHNAFWWIPIQMLERLWMYIHPVATTEDLTADDNSTQQQQLMPVGETRCQTLEDITATWGCTSPYASYSQTLIRSASFSDDFENAITPNTPQGYRAGKYF